MADVRGIGNPEVLHPGSAGVRAREHGRGPWAARLGRVTGVALVSALILAAITTPAFAASITWTVPAGANPRAVAVNETTNKAYVVNSNSNNVTVIDGAGATTTVDVGPSPDEVAVNETTNKAYVANVGGNNVTVIDGDGSTTPVGAGSSPCAVAVNETTNKAYVANYNSGNVTVIDGDGSPTTIDAGSGSCSVAVNEATNKVYVANFDSNNVTVIDGDGSPTTIATGSAPWAVAVNEISNKAYVANYYSGNVTVIDGAGATTTVDVGPSPDEVAVNETTNKAYVANVGSNYVTVIDGDGSPTPVGVGSNPDDVAVNETTNKAYVANWGSNNVTVIHGDGLTTTIDADLRPVTVAVNETTNKAYVVNSGGRNVTVIDGEGITTTVPVGTGPCAVAVNEISNKAYVANYDSNSVTVIHGDGLTTTVATGSAPCAVAVNENTNRAYVANRGSNNVTVIDGDGSPTNIPVGNLPSALAVNEATNKVYVANNGSNNVTVIDGDGSPISIPTGNYPYALAVNEATNKVYVANNNSGNVTVINGDGSTTPVDAGSNPCAVAVKESTDRVYVANSVGGNVTVINGDGSTTTIDAGSGPCAVAVNENVNRAYAANRDSNDVTVIDGAGATTTVPAGNGPYAVAVNETTNKAYVANSLDDNVTVIIHVAAPKLATSAVTGVTANSASAGGNVSADGGDPVTLRGVCWNTSPDPTVRDSHTMDGGGVGAYTSTVTGLNADTRYYVRAFAISGGGTAYGEERSFSTPTTPTLTTAAADSITNTRATLHGAIAATGGQDADRRGFQYKIQGKPTWSDWHEDGSFAAGDYSRTIDGLSPGKTYDFRSYARNSAGDDYGATLTFTTQADPPPPPPPESLSTWYLAEGTTAWGFSTYISIQNPNPSPVSAKVTLMPRGGANANETITLPPNSQTTLSNDYLVSKMGGEKDFSTKIEAGDKTKTIAADRTMAWTGPGASSPEAHSSIGVTSPARIWYLPEGSTDWGFETWLLIQNPADKEATCTLTYMVEGKGPQEIVHKVPARSRESFSMADDIGQADASIKVDSDVPVIPERAMYRYDRREGHDSIGTTTPAKDFYLAEGAVGYPSDYTTWVLVQNPQGTTNNVTITYQTGSGEVKGPSFTMKPNTRATVRANDTLPPGTDVSTRVSGSAPLIAERAMYWSSPAGEACHDSVGMSAPAMAFYLPDGQTSAGRETWTLVQNPHGTPVEVNITYMTPTGKGNVAKKETIPANSRRTFNMLTHSGIQGRASIMVEAKAGARPVMVERAMYWNDRGAGTDTIGGCGD